MSEHGLDSSKGGLGYVACSCEHGNKRLESCEHGDEHLDSINSTEFLDWLGNC